MVIVPAWSEWCRSLSVRLSWVLVGSLLVWSSAAFAADETTRREPRRAGYLPDYRLAEFAPDSVRGLTDLIVFSAEVAADGDLNLSRLRAAPWSLLLKAKAEHRVRLILCVGGWERSAGFAAMAASPERRARFTAAAVKLCLERRLDGLDLDWEHPNDDAEVKNYGLLLADLRRAFEPHGLLLSMTMAAWQPLPADAIAAADWIQIMSYDHEGRHSTLEAAQADVKQLLQKGARPAQLVLGLPFYGRSIKPGGPTKTYRELVSEHPLREDVDEVAGLYFNGPQMIRKKLQLVREQRLGGVMVWELGQDALGDKSLLRIITSDQR